MFDNKKRVKDIEFVEIKKKFVINENEVQLRIENRMTGVVNGEKVLLDEVLINGMAEQIIQAVKKNCSKYNKIPTEIILKSCTHKEETNDNRESDKQSDEQEENKMIESYEPRFELEQIALNNTEREQIKIAISAVMNKKKMSEDWGMSEHFANDRAIILNFYGKPGTGKSMTAEAVAKALGKKVYHINYSELESKYVGETPKNIRKAFECATKDDAVLIFDEADSFLGKRLSSVTQSADYGVNITRSVLLMELEKFSGVVVFTTNLISNYDEAFKRRILLSVYFEMPDVEAREKIWRLHISEKMPLTKDVTAKSLAERYDGVSGADIKDMVFYSALYALEQEKDVLDFSVFDYSYKTIKERYCNHSDEPKFEIVSKETITEEQYQKEVNG
ncbi:MAG: ATP-binding protein [Ruminococcaceae bacterium]|nr:ATP-binding protein [Oscillospiraceae bacterium]